MEVSVIMSEYNTEYEVLEESIKSILNQTYQDFEFIIVNDGSESSLHHIVNKLKDDRIIILENTKNLGLPQSLNKAINYSSGKYLVRMDTDDIAHPKRIEKQLSFIKTNRMYSVVGTSYNLLTENGKKYAKVYSGEIDKEQFLRRRLPAHPSVIMKKKDIIDVGKYETNKVRRSEDLVLWAKLLLSNKRIYVMEDILLDYRVNIGDYGKRTFSTRKDEVYNRIKYYKKLKASPYHYFLILKSILASVMPWKFMAYYHRKIQK